MLGQMLKNHAVDMLWHSYLGLGCSLLCLLQNNTTLMLLGKMHEDHTITSCVDMNWHGLATVVFRQFFIQILRGLKGNSS